VANEVRVADEQLREPLPVLLFLVEAAQALAHRRVTGLDLERALEGFLDAFRIGELRARVRETHAEIDSLGPRRDLGELRERRCRALPRATTFGQARDRFERALVRRVACEHG